MRKKLYMETLEYMQDVELDVAREWRTYSSQEVVPVDLELEQPTTAHTVLSAFTPLSLGQPGPDKMRNKTL